jgi:putative hydrolase of the HAD superfamily
MLKVIAFDGGDTLWENEPIYMHARQSFTSLLARYNDPDWIGRELDHTESYNVRYYGYGIKSYGLSLVETAVRVTEGQVTGAEIQQILDIIRSMLAAPIEPMPGAVITLERLSHEYPLMLITKGDDIEQRGKINRSGLAPYFKHIEIVAEKTVETYTGLLERYHIQPSGFLMVGNSLKSDILPVLAAGGRAVYIAYTNTWFHEHVDASELEGKQFDEIGKLDLMVDFISKNP